MKTKFIIISFLVTLCLIQIAHAQEQTAIAGNYRIVFSTVPENIDTGLTLITISLEDKENSRRVSGFTTALKIKEGNNVVFSSDEMELDETGSLTLVYNFQKTGSHVVEFRIDDLNISASFRFNVGRDDDTSIILLLVVIIAVSAFLLWRNRSIKIVREETV